MKLLILGGDGMIGHNLLCSLRGKYDVKVTLRNDIGFYKKHRLFNNENSYSSINAISISELEKVFDDFSPDAVINAIGITKKRVSTESSSLSININALFPHVLSDLCEKTNVRLIHLSTDCVFSGKKGDYLLTDVPDADDLYGRTKTLGEVDKKHVVTLRKSTVGLELFNKHGLIEWFLSQKGTIKGYQNAVFTGLISTELANVIDLILTKHPKLSGIWQVASKPINKYDLLSKLKDNLDIKNLEIIPDDDILCDRSLDGSEFEMITGYKAPDWEEMIEVLASQIRARKSNDIE